MEQLDNGHSGRFGQVAVGPVEVVRPRDSDITTVMGKLKKRLSSVTIPVVQLGMNGLSGPLALLHVDGVSSRDQNPMCVLRSLTINRLAPVLLFFQMIHTQCGLNGKHAPRLA